ncbi:phosphatase PAP2 family protein [Gordonia aurantiaca]|uniref:phosphatase PAP2 family protein n=1 Tax=Gordonia sp. B21 TaxID=3151852 RepID=UPI00326576A5
MTKVASRGPVEGERTVTARPALDTDDLAPLGATAHETPSDSRGTRMPSAPAVLRLLLEIAVVLGVYNAYSAVRNAGGKDAGPAFEHGSQIMRLESWLHIDIEQKVNEWVAGNDVLSALSALEYHTLHWWVTIGVVVWLYIRHQDEYRKATLVLAATTLLALVGFYTYPTAPPRMYSGFIDVMAVTSSWGWWAESGSPGPESMTNEFAAMPSLHCGWAIWSGLMIFLIAERPIVRALGVIYPLVTSFVVVGTANHYILDIVAVLAIIAVATVVIYGTPRLREMLRRNPVPKAPEPRRVTTPTPGR